MVVQLFFYLILDTALLAESFYTHVISATKIFKLKSEGNKPKKISHY